MRHLDWNATCEKAQRMTIEELCYAIKDCIEAGNASWDLERKGNRVDKTQGYYHDEASVYRTELKRREKVVA